MKRNRRHPIENAVRRGFTLIEIIVVVTIIALLATLIVPRLLGRVGQAKTSVAKSQVAEIAKQVNLYLLDNGLGRPPSGFELAALTTGTTQYLKPKNLIDPWNREYLIKVPGEVNPDFDIISYGADGQPGGDGEDADIIND